MAGNTPVALDSLPCAREIFRDLDSDDPAPPLYLIRGRSGTGKSVLLSAIRTRLRARGYTLTDNPADLDARAAASGRGSGSPDGGRPGSGPGKPSRTALVVDDAHTLPAAAFDALCDAVESTGSVIVVATRPRPHDPRLRALSESVARRGRVVDLRALGTAEIAPFARELGMMVPRTLALHIHRETGGIHGGVVAALTAACAARLDAGIGAVDDAVSAWARARLDDADPDLLDTFVVAAAGAGLDTSELTEVLGVTPAAAQDLVDRARGSALVTDADLLLHPAIMPLRTLVGDRRYLAVQRLLLHARLDAGLLRDHTALHLAESGVRDPRLAEFLCTTAEKAGDEAVRHYAAAAQAGADTPTIALRWADAAARTGDCDTALRLAEPTLSRPDAAPADLAAAVRICAGVWTRRALTTRAAQLYTWLGPHRVGPDWAVAAAVLYLSGDLAAANTLAATATHWPPTEATARAGMIATALGDSMVSAPPAVETPDSVPAQAESTAGRIDSDPSGKPAETVSVAARTAAVSAASALIHATHSGVAPGDNGGDRFLPCSAVSIATLLCLSMGEPRRAADALRGAGTDPQQRVLAAWVAMLGGDEQSAAAIMTEVQVHALDARDRLLAHGVLVGLARRGGDHPALALAWHAAYPLFDEVGADLLALLPIGELWLAAIRLKDESRVKALVDAAAELLGRLGDPPAWSNAFHWYAIQAAIAHESPDELLPHAHSLKAAAQAGDPQAAALADAGRTWVLVLRGQVDREQVEAAVERLAALGLSWDAARLASEAALAAQHPVAATALLKLARTVRAQAHPSQPIAVRPPAPAAPVTRPEPMSDTVLSEREREVAELVLLGLTYREIGARLYISAKTVEHHVARIRRRIGAGSRSELLSMLRAMGHGSLLV
ncbi:LuxR C-terminal-related transcriptional regulator [Nocardia inohanensis]|uniref:LuxR C-terminal-related transcriptional regulator n=1 Tax=Nocardia inohanensis TaxID=209246 RepID=UPI00082C8212|nr:LuxR C-terminal-related transcriptional regulator [Nocardia inohanensis]